MNRSESSIERIKQSIHKKKGNRHISPSPYLLPSDDTLSLVEPTIFFVNTKTVVFAIPVHTVADNSFHADLSSLVRHCIVRNDPDRTGSVVDLIGAAANLCSRNIHSVAVADISPYHNFLVRISR